MTTPGDSTEREPTAHPHPVRSRIAALAGMLAGALALGVSELLGTSLTGDGTLVSGVGSWFVNIGAASLKEVAIAVFGTHDKDALLIGIVLVCLGLSAAIGVLAARRAGYALAGFVLFGVIAVLAAASSSPAPIWVLVVSAVGAVVSGVPTLLALLAAAKPRPATTTAAQPAPAPSGEVTRRFVALSAGAVAVAAATGATGRRLSSAPTRSSAAALAARLPRPTRITPVPTEQPFTTAGLSEYVTPTKDFYRIDTALLVPKLDPQDWTLVIDGKVDRPLTLTYSELVAMATVSEPITMSCVSNEVGGDLVGNAVWQGVPLATLLAKVGVQSGGTQILGHSHDNFTAGFPTEVALDGRPAMVVVGMNGAPLPVEHGFPARIVVSGLYGYVSAVKWLTRIELTGLEEADGFWIPRGWSKLGPIKTQSRIDVPRAGDVLPAGPIDIAGVAWAPHTGITTVEVQVDDGPWQPAELGTAASNNTWVQWRLRWATPEPGTHTLSVRATDSTGTVQTTVVQDPQPSGATGLHRREITVRAGA